MTLLLGSPSLQLGASCLWVDPRGVDPKGEPQEGEDPQRGNPKWKPLRGNLGRSTPGVNPVNPKGNRR